MIRITWLLLLTFSSVFAQGIQPISEIGHFKSASSFDINAAGYIFVCDSETNEIYKLSPAGNLIKTIGGYGWNSEAYDNPVDIYATMLNVYVSDFNNHRIQILDKDLNFLSSFKSGTRDDEDYTFAYPLSCVVSSQGDMFILDGDNQRILKYDLTGNFLTEIGNTDAGEFALNSPHNLAVSNSDKIFVTDGNIIKVFDIFGNGLTKINPGLENPRLRVFGNTLTVNGSSRIKYLNLKDQSSGFILFEPALHDMDIKESIVTNEHIFVLTADKIYKYKR